MVLPCAARVIRSRLTAVLCAAVGLVRADVAPPPLESSVAALRERVVRALAAEDFDRLAPGTVEALLTPAERTALSQGYLRFHLDQPARLIVFRDQRLAAVDEPFWLPDLGFRPAPFTAVAYQQTFDAWEKDVPAGETGLGVHALRRFREHYFVVVAPRPGHPAPAVSPRGEPPPGLTHFTVGAQPWVDRDAPLTSVPAGLAGLPLLQTHSARRPLASVYDYFRVTSDPAGPQPDQIVLTPTADPARALGLSWRTDITIAEGLVQVRRIDHPAAAWETRAAATRTLSAPRTLNQQSVHRHALTLDHLQPDTPYEFRVGAAPDGPWSAPRRFRTAPSHPREVRFLMFGDVQEKYDVFAPLLRRALAVCPAPDFVVFAGDLVSRGNDSDDWDAFFAVLDDVALPAPLVPAIGNHELLPGDAPDLYRDLFVLPENGPVALGAERAYTFRFAGVRLLVLDSNTDGGQTAWIEQELNATGPSAGGPVVVVAHHGAYTSRPGRYYPLVREHWAPLFESHGVPLVLQGHDHAYLRTHPMGTPGTTYLIATAGGKFYPQAAHPYSARALTDLPTFQVITVSPSDGQVSLRAYDSAGRLVDDASWGARPVADPKP